MSSAVRPPRAGPGVVSALRATSARLPTSTTVISWPSLRSLCTAWSIKAYLATSPRLLSQLFAHSSEEVAHNGVRLLAHHREMLRAPRSKEPESLDSVPCPRNSDDMFFLPWQVLWACGQAPSLGHRCQHLLTNLDHAFQDRSCKTSLCELGPGHMEALSIFKPRCALHRPETRSSPAEIEVQTSPANTCPGRLEAHDAHCDGCCSTSLRPHIFARCWFALAPGIWKLLGLHFLQELFQPCINPSLASYKEPPALQQLLWDTLRGWHQ